jgi:PAS domain S-box-containing protein
MTLENVGLPSALDVTEVFDGLPVAIRIEDFSKAKDIICTGGDVKAGDIKALLHEQPDRLRRLLAAIEVTYANAAALRLYRAADLETFARIITTLRLSKPFIGLYSETLRALGRGMTSSEREHELKFNRSDPLIVRSIAYWSKRNRRSWSNVIWFDNNVTQDKAAAAELRLSEMRLKAMVAHAPVAIALEDLDGHVLLANRKATELFGQRSNSPDRAGRRTQPLDDPAGVLSTLSRQVLASGRQSQKDITIAAPDRTLRVELIKFPVFAAEKTPIAIGMVGIDVTKQRQAEEELRQSVEELARA